MIRLLGNIPKIPFYVACSGGTDSMMLVDFLMRYPRNKFEILHFNHGTEPCQTAEKFVKEFCKSHGLALHLGKISRDRQPNESQEEYWRKERYNFLGKFSNKPILMSHHLNDCIETWIMTSLHGQPKLIPYCNPKYNIIRPLLATPKSAINDWLERHHVEYVYDTSNSDTTLNRNRVRHCMMEHVYAINPGIEKTIKNKVLSEYKAQVIPT